MVSGISKPSIYRLQRVVLHNMSTNISSILLTSMEYALVYLISFSDIPSEYGFLEEYLKPYWIMNIVKLRPIHTIYLDKIVKKCSVTDIPFCRAFVGFHSFFRMTAVVPMVARMRRARRGSCSFGFGVGVGA